MSDAPSLTLIKPIAEELKISLKSIISVVDLLESGCTIPFIARYRKEVTGNLDETQIKAIQDIYHTQKELQERKLTVLASIESQGKLTADLAAQIESCVSKTALEDIYLPYKPKRRTKAMIAREKGLEPLADIILSQSELTTPIEAAKPFVDPLKGVDDEEAALKGARDIVAEKIAENKEVRSFVRHLTAEEGCVVSKARKGKEKEASKFEQYYDFKEPVKTIPSHRYLAIRRGEKDELLDFSIEIDPSFAKPTLEKIVGKNPKSSFADQLSLSLEDAFSRLLFPSVETDLRIDLKNNSDKAAIAIFSDNLKNLLLAAPLGGKKVLGIDPGVRTGCKCAVVDATGKYLSSATMYLSQGESSLKEAKKILIKLLDEYEPFAIAIGNGTAGRETETFVRELLKEMERKAPIVVLVNEAGASVYSASEVAREEFAHLDITIRGAISIARRLQDPLAELVKIDPKSIGVGQYQHDVNQILLQEELEHVVTSCVNKVGVDLNTASTSLLTFVSGIGPSLAKRIVSYREINGVFKNRDELKNISGFGPKTFEQAAGFLRILGGENPLDASAVHPERYDVVEKIATDLGVPLRQLCGSELTKKIDKQKYVSLVGELTLKDIIDELIKPGRDPRSSFEPPSFRPDVMKIEDVKCGMKLEGIVTNITAFGAFVDIGVHQDGLVHISELADHFVKDPHEVVKTGDKIKVEVIQIDYERKRIMLTARKGQRHMTKASNTDFQKNKLTPKAKSFEHNPFSQL